MKDVNKAYPDYRRTFTVITNKEKNSKRELALKNKIARISIITNIPKASKSKVFYKNYYQLNTTKNKNSNVFEQSRNIENSKNLIQPKTLSAVDTTNNKNIELVNLPLVQNKNKADKINSINNLTLSPKRFCFKNIEQQHFSNFKIYNSSLPKNDHNKLTDSNIFPELYDNKQLNNVNTEGNNINIFNKTNTNYLVSPIIVGRESKHNSFYLNNAKTFNRNSKMVKRKLFLSTNNDNIEDTDSSSKINNLKIRFYFNQKLNDKEDKMTYSKFKSNVINTEVEQDSFKYSKKLFNNIEDKEQNINIDFINDNHSHSNSSNSSLNNSKKDSSSNNSPKISRNIKSKIVPCFILKYDKVNDEESQNDFIAFTPKNSQQNKYLKLSQQSKPQNQIKMRNNSLFSNIHKLKIKPFEPSLVPNNKMLKNIFYLSEKGSKDVNQDNFLAITNIFNIEKYKIFSVFDGHGQNGHFISKIAKQIFSDYFSKNSNLYYILRSNFNTNNKNISLKDYVKQDDLYKKMTNNKYQLIKEAFYEAENRIKECDYEKNYSGTTACSVFIVGEHVICGNVGDSRAIMVSKNNNSNNGMIAVTPLSVDHKPNIITEKNRIINCGGEVHKSEIETSNMNVNNYFNDCISNTTQNLPKTSINFSSYCKSNPVNTTPNKINSPNLPYRVYVKDEFYPGLAMSRSLGDFVAKTIGVISEPDFIDIKINQNDLFIILASDGLWEYISNEKAAEVAYEYYLKKDAEGAVRELIRMAKDEFLKVGEYVDDITVICVFLN